VNVSLKLARNSGKVSAGRFPHDFAPSLGITQGQLSKIERGKLAPSVTVLLRLQERFRKSVDWILTGKE